VQTGEDREEAAQLLTKYDFLALPVVDNEGRLVGMITIDDAIDVISEEDEEDIAKMSAITPTDRPYIKTSTISIWLSRIPWLLILMISATFTGIIISSFESALAAQVALTAFIPMLMGTGGNAGSQASVTVIRGLSLDEIEFGDLFRVLFKELRVSLLCGITLSAATFLKIILIDNLILGEGISYIVAAVVSITMAVTVILAKLIGCSLPLIASKLKLDPAVMASPFITTIVDALSLLVYFYIASAMLGL
jgi:magnesium transporter